jgi:hypothetical protein
VTRGAGAGVGSTPVTGWCGEVGFVNGERAAAHGVAERREPVLGVQGGYALWVAWIEAFRRGDDRDIAGLPPIDGRMGSYVEARLLERLSAAFSARVRDWQTVLGTHIVAAPPVDADAVDTLLRDAGSGLEPLARLAGSSLLPRTMSLAMHELLGQVRAGARDAVEESARRVSEPEVEPRIPRAPRRPRAAAGPAGSVPAPRVPGARGVVPAQAQAPAPVTTTATAAVRPAR